MVDAGVGSLVRIPDCRQFTVKRRLHKPGISSNRPESTAASAVEQLKSDYRRIGCEPPEEKNNLE